MRYVIYLCVLTGCSSYPRIEPSRCDPKNYDEAVKSLEHSPLNVDREIALKAIERDRCR